MRQFAYLKEPLKRGANDAVYKIMLYDTNEGCYLFEYGSLDAVQCSSDQFYDSLEELYEDWNDLIDERGWIRMENPLPDCQHDAFIPIRVKGRETGMPEWGKFETLRDGKWVDYDQTNEIRDKK